MGPDDSRASVEGKWAKLARSIKNNNGERKQITKVIEFLPLDSFSLAVELPPTGLSSKSKVGKNNRC